MGGTSFDAALFRGGEPRWSPGRWTGCGCCRSDITTIGAGGGSIGWIDKAACAWARSAGAQPGPAATGAAAKRRRADADVVLGYLPEVRWCSGSDVAAARAAIEPARGLRMTVEQAASA